MSLEVQQKNVCNLGMPCSDELGRAGEGAGGHEAHAGPQAEIEKPPHQGLGIMGRDFPSSRPSWEMQRTAWVRPRQPAVGCYHGKHPKGQRKYMTSTIIQGVIMRVSCLRWAGFYFQGPVVFKSPKKKEKVSVL